MTRTAAEEAGRRPGPRRADLKEALSNKWLRPAPRRQAVGHLTGQFQCSDPRACKALAVCRAMVRYQSQRVIAPELVEDLRQVPMERPRFGYRRLHVILRRKG